MAYTIKKYRPLYNGILRCDDKGVVMFGDSDYALDRKYKDRSSEFSSGLSICIRVNTKQLWWLEVDYCEGETEGTVLICRNNDIIVQMSRGLFETLFEEVR